MPANTQIPLVTVVRGAPDRPAAGVVPGADQVDVWRAELHRHSRSWADADRLLPAAERAALEPVAQPHRDRRLTARVLQRTVLAQYLGVPAPEVCYTYAPDGKPSLAGSLASSGLEFSSSSSGDYWLIAVSTAGPVGIDAEVVAPVPEADQIVARLFDPAEAAALADAGSDDDRLRRFLRLWTAKEAYGKALGTGLVPTLAQFVVPPSFGAEQAVWGDDARAGPWCLVRLDLSTDVVASVAARTPTRNLAVVIADVDPTAVVNF